MHAIVRHDWAYFCTKFGQIKEIKVSMESGEHTRPVWAHNMTKACKLACMHAMCLCTQAYRGMPASLRARVDLYAQKDTACYPDSIYNLISLIHSNLAEIWANAHKHITWMHTSLHALVVLCTQIGVVCSPDSIDTFIFLIQPNLAEIWAQAPKHIACMHAILR